nr:hypothetical protein [Salinigranum rubrum]
MTGLANATLRVETGDVEEAIEQAATDSSTVIIGATEKGLLSRLLRGALVLDVVDDVECSCCSPNVHGNGVSQNDWWVTDEFPYR